MVVHFLLLNCHRSSGAAMHRTHVYPYMHASSFASGTNCRVHAIGCGTFLPALAVVVQYLQHSAVALYMSCLPWRFYKHLICRALTRSTACDHECFEYGVDIRLMI
jgi:hypothetical protein